ncbi:MAG: sterol desaturase family protein [Novosphingobium sp.]|jgi:sterol desaturase/sphingolipid hydroxylase (fatty acid hydroxylase superfamily)|nr:sterol desaturase family protein [Novosphingobium sp.]
MDTSFLGTLAGHYNWQLSLYALLGILAVPLAGRLFRLIPAFGAAHRLNSEVLEKKMERPAYAENQRWNRKWGGVFMAVIFGLILPFCLTAEPQPWWKVLLDIVVILMVYDFFYYLTHRFLFHDSKFLGGPLMWVHAVHHRQHNPCRQDSSYIHPIEVAMGLGLFVATIFGLSFLMGNFHVVTLIVTWVAFSQINLHNHTLWEADRFPYRYMTLQSQMHHNHHARFTGGNFATISLLYDWMFGSLDYGQGWGPHLRRQDAGKAA